MTVIATAVQVADQYLGFAPLKLRYEAAEGIISLAKGLLGAGTDPTGYRAPSSGDSTSTPTARALGDLLLYPDPGNEAPGAAYTWSCVSASGAETPLVMQNACFAMYPAQVTIAYPQDVNNAYSWVCIAPSTGTFTTPTRPPTPWRPPTARWCSSSALTARSIWPWPPPAATGGTVVIESGGSGYIAYDGGGSSLPI